MRNLLGLVIALLIAAGAGKALIDAPPTGGQPGESFTLIEKQPAPDRGSARPDEPPPMTCDAELCWWTEMGRPTLAP